METSQMFGGSVVILLAFSYYCPMTEIQKVASLKPPLSVGHTPMLQKRERAEKECGCFRFV